MSTTPSNLASSSEQEASDDDAPNGPTGPFYVGLPDAAGDLCYFAFNPVTKQMTPYVSEPDQSTDPRRQVDLTICDSKICENSLRVVVHAYNSKTRLMCKLLFEGDSFVQAPECECSSCRSFNNIEDDFLRGRRRVGYKKMMKDENGQPLIPISTEWKHSATLGTFVDFVDTYGNIGRYVRNPANTCYVLSSRNNAVRTNGNNDFRIVRDDQFVLHSHHNCTHLNMTIFNASIRGSNIMRHLIFNPHHMQFDEIVCRECVNESRYSQKFELEKGRLAAMTATFVPVIRRSVGIFTSPEGNLEWGIYSPQLNRFVQQKGKPVVNCTMHTINRLLNRHKLYENFSKQLMEFHEFYYSNEETTYHMVFVEHTMVTRIYWAVNLLGCMHPFTLGEYPGSVLPSRLRIMRAAEVEQARQDTGALHGSKLMRIETGTPEQKKAFRSEINKMLWQKHGSWSNVNDAFKYTYRFDPAIGPLVKSTLMNKVQYDKNSRYHQRAIEEKKAKAKKEDEDERARMQEQLKNVSFYIQRSEEWTQARATLALEAAKHYANKLEKGRKDKEEAEKKIESVEKAGSETSDDFEKISNPEQSSSSSQ